MQNNLKRCSALLLAVCLFLSVLVQPTMAAELDDDLMMVDETAEDELTEDGEAAVSDDGEAASGDAAEDEASDGDEYEYDAPTITAVGTGLETNKFYVYITWDVVGENDYKILRSTDGENYTGVGYASYPGEDETTVTYEDIGADLYETCWYAVCCIDDDGNQVSAYTYTTSGHYYPSGSCGDNVAWSISSDGVLTISGSGKMVDAWEEGYAAWYPIRSVVQTVQIGEGVTSVAPYSFQECANLTSVTIPDTVTAIGDCAFFGCSSLTSVTIPEGVTEIPYRAFYLCTGLTSVSLPSTVTTIGDGAFGSCTSLTDLTLPSGLTSLGKSALYKCTSLTSLVIPDGVTVLPMNALYSCTGLTSLTLPSGLTELGIRALFNCCSLTELTLPETLTTIGSGALQLCTGLTELTIPASVNSIGSYAFYACTGLETVCFLGAPPETLSDWFGDVACSAIVQEEYADAWFALDLTAAGSQVTWSCEESPVEYLDAPTVSVSNASTGVKVTWGAVEDAEGYDVYRKTSGGWKKLGSTTSTSYTDTTASSGTTYSYTVCAYAGEVVSDYGTGCSILYLAQPTVTLSGNPTGVTVKWGAVTGAANYRVYRKVSGGSSWTRIATVSSSTLTYTDTAVEDGSGTTYYYTVQAVNSSTTSSYVTNKSVVRLAQPTVTLSNASTGVTVKWGAVTGATGYTVWRKTSGGSWAKIATASSSTLTYTDTTASSGTTYYYTVRATSSNAISSYVTTKSILRLAQPTVALSNASTGVTVKWGAVTGATSYRIYRKTVSGSWQNLGSVSSSTLTYTDTAVADNSGTTYYYTVRAVSGSTLGSYDSSKSIVRLAQPTVTLSNASTGVTVKWGAVTGATGYTVWRKTSGGSWAKIATASGSTLSYTDTAVADNSGTTYYYTVRAVSGSVLSSYDGSVSILRLAQPTVTLSNASTGVTVKWSAVTGATNYRIYRKTVSGSWQNLGSVSSSTLTYTDTAVADNSGTTYYYTVRAVSGSILGSYDSSKSIVRLAQPTVTLSNASTGVTVKWGAVTGATGYTVWRKTSGGSWAKIATVSSSTLTYTDTTASSGTTYYYTVRAVCNGTLSSYETNKSITR